MNIGIAITPGGHLRTEEASDSLPAVSTAAAESLEQAFGQSSAAGLLRLSSQEIKQELPTSLVFWRRLARQFFHAVCQLGEGAFERWATVSAPHTYNDVDTFDDFSLPGHRGEQNQWGGRTWYRKTFTVPAAVDPEGQALTYSGISKPSWLSFNFTTRTLSGTPPTLGLQAVVLEAQDTFGETVRLSFSIDVGNRAPTWGSLPDIVAQAGTPVDYTPPAAIDPDGELLIYSASGLPAGLLLDTTNGRISGTSNAVGVFAVTLTGCGETNR
jgi:hypothetical protein